MSKDFLKVNKARLSNTEFSLLEKLIVAQINEYERKEKECYMTDKQFAVAFGVSTQQVTRAMKKLADNNIIQRNTKTVSNNGKASKYRTLKAIVKYDYSLPEGIVTSDYSLSEGIVKNDKRNSQNDSEGIVTSDYIKDNLKDNIKENLRKKSANANSRKIEDLSEKEANEIINKLKSKVNYVDIQKEYNLEYGSVTKDFEKQWKQAHPPKVERQTTYDYDYQQIDYSKFGKPKKTEHLNDISDLFLGA